MVNSEERLDLIFGALSDGTRRAMLMRLGDGEATVSELAEPFDMSIPAITKHLNVLERAGLSDTTRVVIASGSGSAGTAPFPPQ